MKKAKWLLWINLFLTIAFVIQTISAIFHEVIPFKIFVPIHTVCGTILITLAVVHIIFNWNWVKTNIFGLFWHQ